MASLTKDQVRHIAKLARLRLTDAEVEKFTTELTSVLEYIDMLKEVDTAKVDAVAMVTGISHVSRVDEVIALQAHPEELLSTSPLPIVDDQIQTPSAHG